MRRVFAMGVLVAATVVLSAGVAPANGIGDRAVAKQPVGESSSVSELGIPNGADVAVFGLDESGRRFHYTYEQTPDKPRQGPTREDPTIAGVPVERADTHLEGRAADTGGDVARELVTEAVAAADAICTVYISDVSVRYDLNFQWETSQWCSGAFGQQYQRTQMWRSSWSGPRGYGGWGTTAFTTDYHQSAKWTVRCGNGGTYDYYPVVEGYASAIGYSPTVRSDNQLRRQCGTSP